MWGSRPLADAVTRSTGTGRVLVGSAARSAAMRVSTAAVSAGFVGPRFEPLDAAALYGCGAVAEGRLQKYCGELNGWPSRREPTALPSCSSTLPCTSFGNATRPTRV